MESKVSEWRPGPTVCRCCLSEGCYKDISTEYFWMGKREVYAEMLSETLDLSISYSASGGPNSNSRLICENCIARLRDATDFKRQVQECEKTFIQHIDGGANITDAEVQVESAYSKPVKVEDVKLEKRGSDDDFDDRGDFLGADDDDDDLDDQPLTKIASRTPKKETVDILDLLDNAKAAEKRKSTTKTKTPPAKKLKKKEPLPKPSASKTLSSDKKKKGFAAELSSEGDDGYKEDVLILSAPPQEHAFQSHNVMNLLGHSTACPFKFSKNKFCCYYCSEGFEQSDKLVDHVKNHEYTDVEVAFFKITVEFVKVDVTDLKCKICNNGFDGVKTLAEHLCVEHDVPLKFEAPLGVIPYKLDSKNWRCVCCDNKFSNFVHLNRHMVDRFKDNFCGNCKARFTSYSGLRAHLKSMKCLLKETKVFKDRAARQNAEIIVRCSTAYPFRIWLNQVNCVFCRDRFIEPNLFRYHMVAKHENFGTRSAFYKKLGKEFLKIDITDLKCKICSIEIDDIVTLMSHLKNEHDQAIDLNAQCGVLPYKLDKGKAKEWVCVFCPLKFPDFENLIVHTPEHLQNYVCDSCGKGFITEIAFRHHKRVPHENSFRCYRCIETFPTNAARKEHIKTKHVSKPYACNFCDDKPRFESWDSRKRHLITVHKMAVKAYECEVCKKSFKTRSTKSDHMRKVHSERQFPCSQCATVFYSHTTLDTHITRKHAEN